MSTITDYLVGNISRKECMAFLSTALSPSTIPHHNEWILAALKNAHIPDASMMGANITQKQLKRKKAAIISAATAAGGLNTATSRKNNVYVHKADREALRSYAKENDIKEEAAEIYPPRLFQGTIYPPRNGHANGLNTRSDMAEYTRGINAGLCQDLEALPATHELAARMKSIALEHGLKRGVSMEAVKAMQMAMERKVAHWMDAVDQCAFITKEEETLEGGAKAASLAAWIHPSLLSESCILTEEMALSVHHE